MAEKNSSIDQNNGNTVSSDASQFQSGGGFFEIHIKGQLDQRWSEWLDGMEMELLDNGEMILYGAILDQAALLGLLNKLSHLNLTLLSVNKVNRKVKKETK